MKKPFILIGSAAGISLAAAGATIDARNVTGLWSNPATWAETGGMLPGADDLVRIRNNAHVTLDSDSGEIGLVYVGIFTTESAQGSLLVAAGGTLTVLGPLQIAPRADNVGAMTVNGGNVAGSQLQIGGTPVAGRSNAKGTLNIHGGAVVLSGDLSVGSGIPGDSGITGTVSMTGGLLEFNRLFIGTGSSMGTVNLHGGTMRIRAVDAQGIEPQAGMAKISIGNGIIEWLGDPHAGDIQAMVEAGLVEWSGTTTNMLFDVWDYSATNATSALFAYRDVDGIVAENATFVWSVAHPLPEPEPEPEPEVAFIVNTRLFRAHGNWHKLVPWNDKITALRLPAGSRGQWTWNSAADIPQKIKNDPAVLAGQVVVTDAMIQEYAAFAAEKGIETYYALNINDTLANQTNLLNRLLAAGVNLTHVELGNETYLPKYRNGSPWGALGLVEKITLADYLSLASTWLPALQEHYPSIKRLIVGSHNGDAYRMQWNAAIRSFHQDAPSLCNGVVVHLYVGGDQQNEEESVGELFAELASWDAWALPIHITESGDRSADYTVAGLERYKTFQRRVYEYLEYRKDGSRMGTHVLHIETIGGGGEYAVLYDNAGITPIGQLALEFPYEPLDTDQDGIPDWWERTHFGGPVGAVASNLALNAINTVLETYVAGLDPNDPQSVFGLTAFDAHNAAMQWQAVPGRLYTIYWTPDLRVPFSAIGEVAGPSNSFVDPDPDSQRGFYRLGVALHPEMDGE